MFTQEEIIKAFGPYVPGDIKDVNYIESCLYEIENFPSTLKRFFDKLKPDHQDVCYREGSWTYRQVIHHIADSHMQAFTRFKLALTEDNQTIKHYIQNAWAATDDSLLIDACHYVNMIHSLHIRWSKLMRNMSIEDFQKTYFHPETQKEFTLGFALGLYAWHGKHHYTQMYRYALNNNLI
ncbi:MAG: putative metal-dependent hydrolase [Bacteroidia bacterium]|nr:putative metal-dependent hydrolase [Bacteroidia bacterium]